MTQVKQIFLLSYLFLKPSLNTFFIKIMLCNHIIPIVLIIPSHLICVMSQLHMSSEVKTSVKHIQHVLSVGTALPLVQDFDLSVAFYFPQRAKCHPFCFGNHGNADRICVLHHYREPLWIK